MLAPLFEVFMLCPDHELLQVHVKLHCIKFLTFLQITLKVSHSLLIVVMKGAILFTFNAIMKTVNCNV